MTRMKKYTVFFIIGAVGYAAIELLWRGRTHWSMMIAGGLSFILFSVIDRYFAYTNIIYKAIVASVCITAIEFFFGLFFNVYKGMNIWDYSSIPHNLLGQICPIFSLAWVGIAVIFIPLARSLDKKLTSTK